MTDNRGKTVKNTDAKAARKARLAEQLRENLRRRKQKPDAATDESDSATAPLPGPRGVNET